MARRPADAPRADGGRPATAGAASADAVSDPGVPGPAPAGECEPRPTGWRSWDILRAALLVAGVYLALKLAWVAHPVLLLTFLGVLFGLALSAGADRLGRWRVPRSLAVLGLVLSVFAALMGIGVATAPTLGQQVDQLRTRLPDAVQQIETWVNERQYGILRTLQGERRAPASLVAPSAGAAPAPAAPPISLRERLMQQLSGVGRFMSGFLTSTLSAAGGLLFVIFVAVYVAIDSRLYARGVLMLFPRGARRRAREVLGAIAVMLRRWLLAELVAMLSIAILTTIVLLALGVQAALALGVLAGLLEFIPIIGPILSAVPAVAMGFLDSPQTALYVLLAYTAIQQFESNVLVPLLMKQGLDLPPVLTLLGQGLMSLVFGFLGLLVAVPLLTAVVVACKLLYMQDVLGEEVSLPGDAAAERVPITA